MNTQRFTCLGLVCVLVASLMVAGLAGCSSGKDGAPGAAGVPGPGVAALADSTALTITITGVSVNSPPVVNFRVTNQDGVAVAGFAETDLRFNIAKLIPGQPTHWQSYINRASGGAVQGTQERKSSGSQWGTLVDHKDGTFTYTFATDITNGAVTCPAPCTDADGNALDTSYQAGLTHRVGIQQGNSVLPKANATYDFVPNGSGVSTTRDIVALAKCNECHNKLTAHGSRVETKLCVTCHNPGSWIAGTAGVTPNTPVDFKVLIHKIHFGDELPSVLDPDGNPATTTKGTYAIGTHDFSDVAFPQDVRNCTKCHDGTVGAANATAQGDNWKNQPSKAACSSCHDDVYFGASPDPLRPYQVVSHMTLITNAGGVAVADPVDSLCVNCHATGQLAGGVDEKHAFPALVKAEAAKYKLNIVSVTNTTPTSAPTIKFSITNPTNSNAPYDIAATPAITGGSMSLAIAWNTTDINNNGRSNAQPITISLLSGGALAGTVTNNGDGTYSVTSGTAIPADATGTGRAGFYARMSVDVNGDATKDTIQVKSVVKDFLITGSSVVARRTVVDIAKCDKCHDKLSLHGGLRTDEPQLCVMCHNPNATDLARRPRADLATAPSPGPCAGQLDANNNPALANAINCNPAAGGTIDSGKEQAIDFKRMVHGIHAAAQTRYDGTAAHGFREKGLVVYGFYSGSGPVNPADFSGLRFPGILEDCTTCHTSSSYQLTGIWEDPTLSGILGSTINSAPLTTDSLSLQTDDLNITPIAATCSSCHDGDLARQHMLLNGASFSATQGNISGHVNSYETCAVCHGPGRTADVKVVHGVP